MQIYADVITVSHLTPYIGAKTVDLFPVANNCLVDDLEAAVRLIVTYLEAEAAAARATPLLQNMQDAANHLAQPVAGNPPVTW